MAEDESWSVIDDRSDASESSETFLESATEEDERRSVPVIRQIGPYDVLETLGVGGMGVVFRARHRELDVIRAIKLMTRPESVRGVARFKREAKNLSRTEHPNVVRIHEFGETVDGRLYFVMELVEGRPLSRVLKLEALELDRALSIAAGIAEGVQALHEAGVIHRDLKPQNIVLAEDGRPVVLDLGLAVNPELDERLTKTGTTLGTVNYMSPEQFRGAKQVSPLTDVYALGLLLYELACGEPATDRELAHQEVAGLVLHGKRSGPSAVDGSLPARLDTVVLRALEREPGDRYPSARAFAEAVRAVQADPGPAADRLRRRKIGIVAGAFALLAVIALVAMPSRDDDPVVAPVDTSAPTATDGLSPKQIADGRRQLEPLARLAPSERWQRAEEWLERFPGHPDARAAQRLRTAALLETPLLVLEHSGLQDAVFAGDEHVLTVGHDWHVRLWSARTGEKVHVWACKAPLTRVAVRPDGLACVAGSRHGVLVYMRLPDGDVQTLPPRKGRREVTALAFDATGERLAVGGRDGVVDVLEVPSGDFVQTLRVDAGVTGLAFALGGARLISTSGTHLSLSHSTRGRQLVQVIDVSSGEIVKTHELATIPQEVSVAADGRRFVIPGDGRRLLLFDVETGESRGEFLGQQAVESEGFNALKKAHDGVIRDAVVAANGRVYSVCGEPGTRLEFNQIRVWDLETRAEVCGVLAHPTSLMRVDAAPDGERVVVRAGSRAEIWELNPPR